MSNNEYIASYFLNKAFPMKKPAMPSLGMGHGAPIGTVHTRTDGDYRKISMSPSVWIKVTTGTLHATPGGAALHHSQVLNDKEVTMYNKLKLKLEKYATQPEKATRFLDAWVKNLTLIKQVLLTFFFHLSTPSNFIIFFEYFFRLISASIFSKVRRHRFLFSHISFI